MAFPTFVQVAQNGYTANTTGTVTLGVAPTAGNYLIMVVEDTAGNINTLSVPSFTFFPGSQFIPGGLTGSMQAFYRKVQAGDSSTWTVNATSTDSVTYTLIEIAGVGSTPTEAGFDVSAGANPTIITPAITAGNGYLIVAADTHFVSSITDTNLSGITQWLEQANASYSVSTYFANGAATGSPNMSITYAAAPTFGVIIVSFAPIPVPPPPRIYPPTLRTPRSLFKPFVPGMAPLQIFASGTGRFSFTGSGISQYPSTGTGTYVFTGTATARAIRAGSGTGTYVFTGAATGKVSVTGTGTGSYHFTGTAVANPMRAGTATGHYTFKGTSASIATGCVSSYDLATAFVTSWDKGC